MASRKPDRIVWPRFLIEEAINLAEAENLSLILIHSHPGGLFDFSESDARVIPGLFEAHGSLHGSAIMIPDGRLRGRLYTQDGACWPINLVSVIGDDIDPIWNSENPGSARPVVAASLAPTRWCTSRDRTRNLATPGFPHGPGPWFFEPKSAEAASSDSGDCPS